MFGIIGLGIVLYLFRNVIGTLVIAILWLVLLALGLSLALRFLERRDSSLFLP